MTMQLVLSTRVLRDFDRLPAETRLKLPRILHQLTQDHRHPSLGTERFEGGARGIFECRIDQKYRMLVFPASECIHVILADDHDVAYRRGRGAGAPDAVSLLSGDALQIAESTESTCAEFGALFAELTDCQLTAAGVPTALLPAVRDCREHEDVERIEGLDVEVSERLLNFSLYRTEGPTFRSSPQSVEEAAEILEPLGRFGRIELSGAAREFLERPVSGPQLVRGGAGAGKTALAVRIALMEARQRDLFTSPDRARVLFLCFNRNLSRLIEETCAVELGADRGAVEVATIDEWCLNYLSRRERRPAIVGNDDRDGILREAVRILAAELDAQGREFLRGSLSFFVEEISQVIEGRVDLGRDAYLRIERVGRGRALDRAHREIVWRLHEHFSRLLDVHAAIDWAKLGNVARRTLEEDSEPPRYAMVIVDEAQDLSPVKLRICANLAEGDRVVFLADSAQNIYRPGFQWQDIRLKPRVCRLERNLRQTGALHAFVRLVGADLIDQDQSDEGPIAHDPALKTGAPPSIVRCRDLGAEIDFVIERLRLAIDQGREPGDILVLAHKSRLIHALQRRLTMAEIPAAEQGARRETSLLDPSRVRLSTIHAAKGLEAAMVVLVDVNEGSIPTDHKAETVQEDEELLRRARRLLYVACSRATEELWITCSRPRASRFLEKIPTGLVREMRWPLSR